jgi:hypothetical protein
MQDYMDTTLRAAVRSLREVVGPAIDPVDKAAHEQLGLIVDHLEFCLERLDFLDSRERFDVQHYLRLARTLKERSSSFSSSHAAELEATIGTASRALAAGTAGRSVLRDIAADLSGVIREIVRAAGSADEETRLFVESAVLAASPEREAVERSWYLATGIDPAPQEVLPLSVLLKPDGLETSSAASHR